MAILSDIHVGAVHFEEKFFIWVVDYLVKNKIPCILNGDLIENAIISGGAAGEKLLDQAYFPTEQIKYFIHMFKPLAKAGLLFFSTRGNHDARTRREALLDISDLMANWLEIPYYGIGGYVSVEVAGERFLGAVQHGKGGGANPYTELDKMVKVYPKAEFVALGHNHQLCTRKVHHFDVDDDGYEVKRTTHQIRTGSYLGYADYVRDMMAGPADCGSPIIEFDAKKHKISVDINTLTI